jgi:hypothetical protein
LLVCQAVEAGILLSVRVRLTSMSRSKGLRALARQQRCKCVQVGALALNLREDTNAVVTEGDIMLFQLLSLVHHIYERVFDATTCLVFKFLEYTEDGPQKKNENLAVRGIHTSNKPTREDLPIPHRKPQLRRKMDQNHWTSRLRIYVVITV